MPRQARKKSESGIYHVMLRGINKQQIFEDDEDCEKFMLILQECKAISEFKLLAYCLMGNHIHLLIKPQKETLETVFKRIGGRFVYWYNVKYKRTGHLFQDRFKSEPVEDDAYLLTVLRYIHQNPVKAQICKRPQDYKYSSYAEYAGGSKLTDTDFIYEIISKEEFLRYSNIKNDDACLDVPLEELTRITDEQAQKLMAKCSKCTNATQFQALDKTAKEKNICIMHSKGMSIRQISRLTGISVGVTRRCISDSST